MTQNVFEPNVIDDELVDKAIKDQVSGEAAEIAKKEGIDFNDVVALRLDYSNILKIENLWQFKRLVKLQIDNNIIEKIENLDHLVNLRWLDLSFNNITKIENLDKLTQLRDLILFNNRISKLENMEQLVNLNVLSIGNNLIDDLEQLTYLIRFDNLRLLNAAGNPFCQKPEYKTFVLSRLSRLNFLDYKLVEQKAVADARNEYINDVISMEEEAKIVAKQNQEKEKLFLYQESLKQIFLDKTDSLANRDACDDKDWNTLLLMAPEALAEVNTKAGIVITPIIAELYSHSLQCRDQRIQEIKTYNKIIEQAINAADKEASGIIKSMKKKSKSGKKPNQQEISDSLINVEISLVDSFEELFKELERNYIDYCNNIKEFTASCFLKLRQSQTQLNEILAEKVLAAHERLMKSEMDDVSDVVRDLVRDKEAVLNHLTGSNDFQQQRIDTIEENFISNISKHQEKLVQEIQKLDHKRSRHRINEIQQFLATQ